ncbi:MAG: bifunctional heptose 7-phosphate kinase/heptose 1-phosphate adenyltransferase [Terriglobia bacterium]
MRIASRDRAGLLSLINRFARQRIVVLGDLVADEFIHGEISRVSREAPVLILHERRREVVPGGGANAANNLIELGARINLVGALGDDGPGQALRRYFTAKGVSMRRVLTPRGYVTPTKSRVLGGIGHGHLQQVVRVDREPPWPLHKDVRRKLSRSVLPLGGRASALLISDYGYGAVNSGEAEFLRRGLGGRLPVTVDSRYHILSYTHVTASTPNEPEVETALGQRIGDNAATLHKLAARLLKATKLDALLVTRGREGMALYEPGRRPVLLPIFGSDQVADVTGAGDTVIAAFTLALAAGADFLSAAMIANCAGGLVVMKSGTATVQARELAEAVRNA